jgi:hypothetical protein
MYAGLPVEEAVRRIVEELRPLRSEMGVIREAEGSWWAIYGFDDHLPFELAGRAPRPGAWLMHNHPLGFPPSRSDIELAAMGRTVSVVFPDSRPMMTLRPSRIVPAPDVAFVMRQGMLEVHDQTRLLGRLLSNQAMNEAFFAGARRWFDEIGLRIEE